MFQKHNIFGMRNLFLSNQRFILYFGFSTLNSFESNMTLHNHSSSSFFNFFLVKKSIRFPPAKSPSPFFTFKWAQSNHTKAQVWAQALLSISFISSSSIFLSLMASISALFLLSMFLLAVDVKAQQNHSNVIPLGSWLSSIANHGTHLLAFLPLVSTHKAMASLLEYGWLVNQRT